MKRAALLFISGCAAVCAAATVPDSVTHRLKPLEVMGVKQSSAGLAAEAVTGISGADARRLDIDAAKGVSLVAPNFYMPDYGSRMTSSVYVRGLGARIDQPVVGLTVDNIPYLNKDNYDFDLADIESVEVLRAATPWADKSTSAPSRHSVQKASAQSSNMARQTPSTQRHRTTAGSCPTSA